MKTDRRTFLRLIAPSLLLPAVPFRAGSEEPSDAVFLLIDGIGPATPADRLRAFLAPFAEAGWPVGLVMAMPEAPDAALADQVRQIVTGAPDMVEPVLSLPELAALPRYFQRRVASDALKRMAALLGPGAGFPPVTVATDAPAGANFDALRCLGIRNVVVIEPSRSVASTGCADLTVCVQGGTRIAVADATDPTRSLETAFAAPGWAQIAFSLAGIERASVPEARLRAQRACDAIGREIESRRRFVSLPREHARWFGEDQLRFIALRIDAGADEASPALALFRSELQRLGIAGAGGMSVMRDGAGAPPGLTCHAPPPDGQAGPEGGAGLVCVAGDAGAGALPPGLGAAIDLLILPGAPAGFDENGLLSRGETPIADAAGLLAAGQLMRDAIVAIGPKDYATAEARQATLETLRRFRGDEGSRIVDLPAFAGATVAADPVFELLRATRRDVADPADPDALSREELLADARQAWTYFERFSIPATGLCIDTADVQPGFTWLHRELTMWDFGSLIAAVMAAHELGLLPDTDFVARSELLVRALPVARIGALRLPSEVIASDTGATVSGDFNACDTGRLLSVLRELDAHPLTRGIAAEKVTRWDLDGVVVGGHVHSVVNGRLVDRFRSQCTHYTARAFRAHGVGAASPFEIGEEISPTDRAMRLLHALAGLDPLGAEPMLLEALEQGLSEPTALLADVLFGAQKREYESSGTLVCMSEAPINQEPWFTYQGLNVTSSEDRWIVNVTSADPRFATPEFRRGIRLVNTKAAYLWAATRPDAYSTLLVRHVRERARQDGLGFAPGVFARTGLAMPGYVDVNTNGIILEAIAYILRGRTPRARL